MHCRLPTSQTFESVKDGSDEKEDHRHNMHVRETLAVSARAWSA